jgi:hypothetical protein
MPGMDAPRRLVPQGVEASLPVGAGEPGAAGPEVTDELVPEEMDRGDRHQQHAQRRTNPRGARHQRQQMAGQRQLAGIEKSEAGFARRLPGKGADGRRGQGCNCLYCPDRLLS